jgi:hypothetical protein
MASRCLRLRGDQRLPSPHRVAPDRGELRGSVSIFEGTRQITQLPALPPSFRGTGKSQGTSRHIPPLPLNPRYPPDGYEPVVDKALLLSLILRVGVSGQLGGYLTAPANDLEIGEVGLPELVGRRGLVLERVRRFDDDEGRAWDQIVCLEQAA